MEKNAPLELGTERLRRLLFKYALPAIVAMTASSVLNIVDRIFIGQGVGPLAISGLATTLPFMNLGAAFGAMVGVGASSIISIRLGQRDYRTANRVLGNTVTLNIFISLAVALTCWLALDPMLRWFGASDNTLPYAREYMRVLLIGNVISHSYLGLNGVIRSAGHPTLSMLCTVLAVVLNIALDPLFIYVFHWGIAGAAWATVISQAAGLAWQLWLLARPAEVLRLQRGIYRVSWRIIGQILSIGLAPFLLNSCACVVVLFINQGMRKYGDMLPLPNGGDLAVAAYGINNTMVFFFLMIVIGLTQGMQPIVGYNWGARQNARVWRTVRLTAYAATAVTTVGWLLGELYPEVVVRLFTGDADIIRLTSRGFRIDTIVFPIVGVQMVITNMFQSIGHAGKSIFLSLTRQMLFLLPGLYLLPLRWGLDGVWAAIPLSDCLSFIITITLFSITYRRVQRTAVL